MADIFISYSRSDEEFVKRLYRELQRFKVRGFMDSTDIASGASLSRQLKEAVENADAVMVVLSKNAVHSSWVMAEVGLAQSLGKAVIPVLAPGETYDDSVPPQLVDRVVVDANTLPTEEVAARVVAAATNTSVESALSEVQSRALRRQRLLTAIAGAFALISLVSFMTAYFAFYQRQIALEQRRIAEYAQREAEERQKRLAQLTGQSASLAIAPDGKTFATGGRDGSVRLWNARSGETVAILTGHEGTISGLAFSPDGQLLASASWDGSVAVWDLGSGKQLMRLLGHTDAVIGVQFAPDGHVLYSRSVDGTIRQWNIKDGTLIRVIPVPE